MVRERRVEELHDRDIQTVEPEHRRRALVAVVVPGHRRRDDEVAVVHERAFAVDGRVRAVALEDEPECALGVPVGGRDLARQQVLHRDRDGVASGALRHAGVVEAQDAPLGAAAGRHELRRPPHQRLDVLPAPDGRAHRGLLGSDERARLQPGGVEPRGRERGHELLARGRRRCLDAHRRTSLPARVYCTSRRVSSSGWLSIG